MSKNHTLITMPFLEHFYISLTSIIEEKQTLLLSFILSIANTVNMIYFISDQLFSDQQMSTQLFHYQYLSYDGNL